MLSDGHDSHVAADGDDIDDIADNPAHGGDADDTDVDRDVDDLSDDIAHWGVGNDGNVDDNVDELDDEQLNGDNVKYDIGKHGSHRVDGDVAKAVDVGCDGHVSDEHIDHDTNVDCGDAACRSTRRLCWWQ